MSEPRNGYRAWQEGGPNETKHGGPWFVTVPDGGDIEIGYDTNGLPDEYHAKLFAAAEALVKALAVAYHYCHRTGMPREAIEQIEAALRGAVGAPKTP